MIFNSLNWAPFDRLRMTTSGCIIKAFSALFKALKFAASAPAVQNISEILMSYKAATFSAGETRLRC